MLRKEPPAAVAQVLRDRGVDPAALSLCTDSDIDLLGRYYPQWLAVSDSKLFVLHAENGHAELVRELSIPGAERFRAESVVGSGLLQARIDGVYVDVVRYSNRLAGRFEKVARKLDHRIAGEPITVSPDDEVETEKKEGPEEVSRRAVLWRIIKLMRPYSGMATAMMALLAVGIALDLVSPQLTRILVDEVLPGTPERAAELAGDLGQYHEHVRMLLWVVLTLAGVQVMRALVNVANGRLGARVGTAITADMRNRLVDHLQQLSISYYDRQQVGSLVGRVAYDTESLHGFIHQLTGGFLFQLLLVVGVGIVMFSMDPALALFALLPAPLVIAGTLVFWRYVYPLHYRLWDASSKQAGMLSGLLAGIRVVKAFGQEQREMSRFDQTSGTLRSSRLRLDRGMATFNPFMSIIFQLGGWLIWFVGGRYVLRGQMTLGELMAFFGYLWMFYGPLATLTQFTNWLTQFVTQAHRIFEILDTPSMLPDPASPVPLPRIEGRVTFEEVTFGYTAHTPVIRNMSFEIQPGEFIGIVGRSGSGKSTLINLMCRFYDVNEGRVLIDGVDVRDVQKTELRRQIGVVLQEPFLFRGSIWENFTYGLPDAPPEGVIAASKAANCHDFILKHPHAYDTWVGERGAGLSGGERQRVSIARVLLTDPRILILDEATSSIDAESEASIQQALSELTRGRTTLAIAHRLSTLRHATRIMVLDNGRLAEFGTHDELIAHDGLYGHLVRLQGQQIAAASDVEALAAWESQHGHVPRERLPLGVPGAHHPHWLNPEVAELRRGPHDSLEVVIRGDRTYPGVFAVRCLPVHHPDEFIALRHINAEHHEVEVGLIRRLGDWPPEAQQLLGRALLRRYFIHTIERINDIQPLTGYFRFNVETDLGPVEFLMRNQSDRAQDYGRAGKILLDVDENRYVIPDVESLPERDRRVFRRHIYW